MGNTSGRYRDWQCRYRIARVCRSVITLKQKQASSPRTRDSVRRNLGDRALVYVTFRHVTCTPLGLGQPEIRVNRENRGSNPEYVIFPEGKGMGLAKFRIISKQNGVCTLERDPYSSYVLHSDIIATSTIAALSRCILHPAHPITQAHTNADIAEG